MSSLFEYGVNERIGTDNQLVKLNELIYWESIRKELKGIFKNEAEHIGGRQAYDSLKLFKAILLGQWHSLSDPKLEESLRVRLDFMLFTGFELADKLPDETTLCRFRNRLIKTKKLERLLSKINYQLEKAGLKLEQASGAVIDATVIESAASPDKIIEEIPQDRQEESHQQETHKVSYSKDKQARWLKKGRKYHFGYKAYVATDNDKGYINHVHISPANESELKHLEPTIKEVPKGTRIFADKGYTSKANRELIQAKGLKDGIMYKAYKNKPLSTWQKKFNKLISKDRYIVEQCFGTMKRGFRCGRSSYIGQDKVLAQLQLKAICFNLLKASNLVSLR